MHHLLVLLLMASLAVPPVLSQTYQKFVKQHTYSKNTLVDCTRDLNPILKDLNKACTPCNTFILGDNSYRTNLNDVKKVCTSDGGDYLGADLYRSKNNFRVVYCKRDNNKSGVQPPDCVYWKAAEKDIRSKKLLVVCKKSLPVYLYPCTSGKLIKV